MRPDLLCAVRGSGFVDVKGVDRMVRLRGPVVSVGRCRRSFVTSLDQTRFNTKLFRQEVLAGNRNPSGWRRWRREMGGRQGEFYFL